MAYPLETSIQTEASSPPPFLLAGPHSHRTTLVIGCHTQSPVPLPLCAAPNVFCLTATLIGVQRPRTTWSMSFRFYKLLLSISVLCSSVYINLQFFFLRGRPISYLVLNQPPTQSQHYRSPLYCASYFSFTFIKKQYNLLVFIASLSTIIGRGSLSVLFTDVSQANRRVPSI